MSPGGGRAGPGWTVLVCAQCRQAGLVDWWAHHLTRQSQSDSLSVSLSTGSAYQ